MQKRTSFHLETLRRFERSGLRGTDLSQFGVKPWHMASLRHGKRLYPSTLKLINEALDKLQTSGTAKPASPMPTPDEVTALAFAYFDAVAEIVDLLEKQPVQIRPQILALVQKMTIRG